MAEIEKGAVLSECGSYRYLLTRRWDDGPSLAFLMHYPTSTDATIDDPTIRRCMGFAKRLGFSGIEVVNLFAYQATDSKHVLRARDPVGPENDEHIRMAVKASRDIVCAWGPAGSKTPRAHQVVAMLRQMGVKPKCLEVTHNGSPCHPLGVGYDNHLREYA